MSKPLRVLLAEDSEDDIILLLRELKRGGYEPVFERVETAEAMKEALEAGTWDIIISDYIMPQFSGLAALDLLKKSGMDLPFIIVSGKIGEDVAVGAMKAGAHDYIIKGNLARLVPAIERELRDAETRRERRMAEEAVKAERRRFYDVLETLPVYICLLTPDYHVLFANRVFREHFGENRGRRCHDYIFGLPGPCEFCESFKVLQTNAPHHWECTGPGDRIMDVHDFPFTDSDGTPLILEMEIDITERKQAEKALRELNETLEQRVAERTSELRESEAQFRQAIEEAPIPVIMHAEDGQVLQISGTWTELTGYTLAEVPTLDSWLNRAYGEGADLVRDHVHELFQGSRRSIDIEFPIRTLDGQVRYWSFSASAPGMLKDGRRFVVGMAVDITERKRSEEALRQAKEEWERTFDTVPDLIAIMDNQHRIVRANRAMLQRLGVTAEECLGQACYLCVHGADHPVAFCPFTLTLADGRIHEAEVHEERLGGDFLVTTAPLTDEHGQLIGAVHIAHDITERKRAEEDLLKLSEDLAARNVELEELNRELESFSYSVSHDLRAPLRHIAGFVELIRKSTGELLDETSRHYMDNISDAAKKMGTLIDDLLDFSRMGRAAMQMRKVNLGKLLHEVMTELREETAGREILWKIGDLPDVYGDQSMLRLVLVNLVSNAVKFTYGHPQAEIEVGCSRRGDEFVCFIKDNGVGFDMEYADKLFGVFQRLHSSNEFEGTGIGLSLVQRIVSRHGGEIWAEGSVGKGATFYFTLPKNKEN